ncbi:MAG: restriction endonuclease subunit S, partial [Bacteroidales bacterium]|nr:restriction endonuclease subunit S [Bacteroidales bacterium]
MKENWTYKKVKDVCEKASSNIVLNKFENNVGDYALYGASGLVKGVDFYHRDEPYIGIVKDGSGVGRVDVYPAKSSLVGTMQYILPKKDCSLKFLCYALQSLKLSDFVTGAAIPHIYFRDYGECVIPVPPLSTQSRIVSELDLLQSIIDKQKTQLKELDNLAQAIFYDMFGDILESTPTKCLKDVAEYYIGLTYSPN